MKKSFIVLLLMLCVIFSSCTKASKNHKKTTSNSESTATSDTTGTQATSVTSQDISSSEMPPEPGKVVTKTIVTSGDSYYEESGFSKGEQVDDTSYPDKVEKLKTYLLNVIGSDQLLTKLNCTMLNHSKTDEKQLTLGSQSSAGKLEWTSAVPMKSVEVKVCNYYNKYTEWDTQIESYHPESTEVYVGTTSMDIVAGAVDVMPETKTITYAPSETFTTFALGNTQKYLVEDVAYSRAFVYSITISWQY